MKLTDFPSDRLMVEGAEVPIYFEVDDLLPSTVFVDFLVHYEDQEGNLHRKELHETLPCERVNLRDLVNAKAFYAFQVKWKVNLQNDSEVRERLVRINFRVRGEGVTTKQRILVDSPDSIGVAAIDITNHPALTRIMLHEFATLERQPSNDIRSTFDPSDLRTHLSTLSVQQKQLLVKLALQNPRGRLVVFITLYPRKHLRMNADLCDLSGIGVAANAMFSVFFCRDNVKLTVPSTSTSAITLICHTQYFVLDLVNPKTREWITKRVYDGRKPNEWLNKKTPRPIQFMIAAVQPSSMCDGVIWNTLYEVATGNNIMPGNSLHGMINTKGCWMLFRNFNWPIALRDELEKAYLKVERAGQGKNAVIAALTRVGYDIKPGEAPPGFSSSYDKYCQYDRNWAYQWFFHEVVGIKYFGDTDTWGNKKTVNDFNVHGHERIKTFPLSEAGKKPDYNLEEEKDFAYHDFDNRKLGIGPNLFRENVLGIKTAADFAKELHNKLTPAQLSSFCWADVFFYKEDGVNAETLTEKDVKEG